MRVVRACSVDRMDKGRFAMICTVVRPFLFTQTRIETGDCVHEFHKQPFLLTFWEIADTAFHKRLVFLRR